MTPPQGFAVIFPEWNVWQVWGSDNPNQGILGTVTNAGLSLERQLQIWIEGMTALAPGVAVADPFNPAALRGDQVQIIPNTGTLKVAVSRSSVPELGGSQQLGAKDSKAILYSVRFFNRGVQSILPWPHDENYLLENIMQPDRLNVVTNAPAPGSLAGAAGQTTTQIMTVVGFAIGGYLLLKLLDKT